MYKVTIKRSAMKSLGKIPEPYYSKIKSAIFALAENATPDGYKKMKGRDAFRIRVADYRIIYEVFDEYLLIDVVAVGHRKDVYK